jgi:hypothetical protein
MSFLFDRFLQVLQNKKRKASTYADALGQHPDKASPSSVTLRLTFIYKKSPSHVCEGL